MKLARGAEARVAGARSLRGRESGAIGGRALVHGVAGGIGDGNADIGETGSWGRVPNILAGRDWGAGEEGGGGESVCKRLPFVLRVELGHAGL